MFKNKNYRGSVDKFRECLVIDALNINYNATIYLNIGLALEKLGNNEEALDALNKAV